MELSTFFLLLSLSLCNGAKILGFFPVPSYSHYILGHSLLAGLAEKGHEVTMVSTFNNTAIPNYRNIVLDGIIEQLTEMRKEAVGKDAKVGTNELQKMSPFVMFTWINTMNLYISEIIIKHSKIRSLMKEQFDVVIVEQFFNDDLKVYCHHFKAHCIAFTTIGASQISNYIVSNPSPPSYIPDLFLNYSEDMDLFERTYNAFFQIFTYAAKQLYVLPKQEAIIKKHFPETPDIHQLINNVDLVFMNSHSCINQAVPHMPQMIQVGGIHVKASKKLPDDIQKFLDEAKHGAVFFSFGSNIQSKDLPPEKLAGIMKALSKLKQRVLWKFEEENLPGKPNNVMIGKWMPQQEILNHPNVELFLTHGGLLSTIEAIYFGVPLIGVPFMGDQRSNMERNVKNGIALQIAFEDLNERTLTEAFNTIIGGTKIKEAVKKRSALMKDRPMQPLDEAVYWVEYLLRNNGAKHLKNTAYFIPFYKYFFLDVAAIILAFTIIPIFLICKLINCFTSGKCIKKMVSYCCVQGCNIKGGDGIPVDSPLFEQWKVATRNDSLKNVDNHVIRKSRMVCNLHFAEKYKRKPIFYLYDFPMLTEYMFEVVEVEQIDIVDDSNSIIGDNFHNLDHSYCKPYEVESEEIRTVDSDRAVNINLINLDHSYCKPVVVVSEEIIVDSDTAIDNNLINLDDSYCGPVDVVYEEIVVDTDGTI
ncbi:PREDICTED: UDP-glucuronosyltransferase 2B33-like [Nicrophorus vespilloides]|uniref:UDP-glucuronosyltransferase 2B33-like n=1 Tax=Nicrophorus vespilloides TaxID=110193 RepID=A0ABM1NA32_NICVS|nr:PREDICTED: UDP-glucuronosyltransferase 2B33-like [Nicrophorus vespilloides]